MNYLSEIFGLVTKADPGTENGGLFFLHYLVLKLMLGTQPSQADIQLFLAKMSGAYVRIGLYKRSATHNKRTVSHDELTGMIGTSTILNTYHGSDIVDFLNSNYGNYPATGERKHYNPADFYAWYIMTDRWYAGFFAPIYTINLLISSNKEKQNTSSKLIYMSELFIMKEKSVYSKLLWNYYVWRMELMYGKKWVKALFDIYFGSEDMDHPLRELVEKL